MRLVCRECSAAYEAPDSLFGLQPREVRCNRCGYQWTVVGPVTPPADAAAHPAEPAPPPPPAPRRDTLPPSSAQPGGVALAAQADMTRMAEAPAPLVPPAAARPAVPQRAEPATAPAGAPAAASTRTLIATAVTDGEAIALPDSEERRLSHELSFGDTERHLSTAERPRSLRRSWLVVLIVIVVIIAAILFKPQLVGVFPGLAPLYASVGL